MMRLPKTSVTIFGGLNEIGGNKILIEDKGTRIFLDFGKSFSARAEFYDWIEQPRIANGVGDLLALGLLPELSGIYREDLLKLAGRSSREDRSVDAVVLSHAHADHADYISFLREDIPIWMGETTKDIIESLEEDRNSKLEFEITEFKKRPADRKVPPLGREIKTFTTRSGKFQIDSVEIEPVHVDHSLPGCYGFIVTTSDSTLVYSGDLRMHGNKPEMTQEFIERAKDSHPLLMLCEGTRIDQNTSSSEKDVHDYCLNQIRNASNSFVFVYHSSRDVDRFTSFYKIAAATGRRLVVSLGIAKYLLSLGKRESSLELPKPKDPAIVIYKPREKSGTYADSDYDKDDIEYFKTYEFFTAEEVRKNPSKVIVMLGSRQMDELIDIKPRGGIYLHSSSEPFNEEGEIDERRTQNWLDRFGLQRVQSHCSGHASGPDLTSIVSTISPKTVVPIHTEHPELFGKLFGDGIIVRNAELGKPFLV
jgi:ribonuclease J